jgi:hypothetical protein
MRNFAKIIVVAPPFNPTSAGCVVLHELCDALNQIGHECHIVINVGDQFIPTNEDQYFSTDSKRVLFGDNPISECEQIINEGIVVYPEVIIGNPLNAANVVRYVLYFDGAHMQQKMAHSDNDFIITYTNSYIEKYHDVLFFPIINNLFNEVNSPAKGARNFDVTYTDNRKEKNNIYIIDNTIHINKQWPENKSQLANILKCTRYFYSWTDMSSTNVDALLCGAIPILIEPDPVKLNYLENLETGPFPYFIGRIIDGKIFVWQDPDFDAKKNAFIVSLYSFKENWLSNVSSTFSKITKHFNQ